MRYDTLAALIASGALRKSSGPAALIMAEDDVALEATLQHHLQAGFDQLLLFAPAELELDPALEAAIERIDCDVFAEDALVGVVNRLIDPLAGRWICYGYNAEFLFFPFCESRSLRDLISFQSEERREAILSYVIDLYAPDLTRWPNAVSLENAHLDRSGYYALSRQASDGQGVKERQMDFFGGLRWRFEEHIPWDRRKIDRIALFRARQGLRLRPDFTLTDEEMNTYACPWHHNITTTICSFRTAKALRTNPGSRSDISGFLWHRSEPFRWHSQQLMDLGLMEPGQWF